MDIWRKRRNRDKNLYFFFFRAEKRKKRNLGLQREEKIRTEMTTQTRKRQTGCLGETERERGARDIQMQWELKRVREHKRLAQK